MNEADFYAALPELLLAGGPWLLLMMGRLPGRPRPPVRCCATRSRSSSLRHRHWECRTARRCVNGSFVIDDSPGS